MKPIKENYPNIYIIIIAITISLWFEGINEIIHHFVKPSLINGIILCILSLFIFYSDDGSLSELYSYTPKKKTNLVKYGAVIKRDR